MSEELAVPPGYEDEPDAPLSLTVAGFGLYLAAAVFGIGDVFLFLIGNDTIALSLVPLAGMVFGVACLKLAIGVLAGSDTARKAAIAVVSAASLLHAVLLRFNVITIAGWVVSAAIVILLLSESASKYCLDKSTPTAPG